MDNAFIKPASHYNRDLDVIGNYRRDMSIFLSKRTGKPLEQCVNWVNETTGKGGRLEIVDPNLLHLARGKNGDREQKSMAFTEYLQNIKERRLLFSPALTVYENPNRVESLLSVYVTGNIEGRSLVKAEAFDAEMAGDKVLADIKENEQSTYKIANNSVSGGQASPFTIFFNKSAHSSLTSTCRTATSYGNANNEKFLAGNRHYWAPDVVIANITSIIGHVDYDLIGKAMAKFNLVYPSADEVMDVIAYSTGHYWRNAKQMANIRKLVEGLEPIERAAFVYVGDMWHLAKYNREVVFSLLKTMSTKPSPVITYEEALPIVKSMDNDLKAFVSLICAKELDGLTLKRLQDAAKEGVPEAVFAIRVMGQMAMKTMLLLEEYTLLVEAFWVTDNVPSSVAKIRDSVRQVAITSDTDSTIFTVENWVEWYLGKVDFSEEAFSINYAMVYLASQSIIHVLAKLSTVLGVVPEKLNVLAMKNEYAFSVFGLTSMAKHYFAYKAAREGNVFKKLDEEIKGVYLKDSNCPPEIMAIVTETIKEVMDAVIADKQISMVALYRKIAKIEMDIINSVVSGESRYLARANVKSANSYTNPQSSPYQHYVYWQELFASKYGDAPEPPYAAIRVSLDLQNKTAIQGWLANIKDPIFKAKATQMFGNKTTMTTLLLPKDNVEQLGLPLEAVEAMNIRKLVYSTVRPFYLILEALGIYLVNPNNTKLVSDFVREWDESGIENLGG